MAASASQAFRAATAALAFPDLSFSARLEFSHHVRPAAHRLLRKSQVRWNDQQRTIVKLAGISWHSTTSQITRGGVSLAGSRPSLALQTIAVRRGSDLRLDREQCTQRLGSRLNLGLCISDHCYAAQCRHCYPDRRG